MEFIVASLLLIIVVLLFFLLKRQAPQPATDSPAFGGVMQQQIDALRLEVGRSLQSTSESVSRNLKDLTDTLFQTLRNTTESLNQQLGAVVQQMQAQTSDVGSRLDGAAKVIGEVQKNLGQLGQAAQEMKELGQSVSKLDELLRAPKLRGGLGEAMLEELLKQVLPTDAFEMQYRFRNGLSVDAVVKTSGGMVPIDSKFPLENFRKMMEAQLDAPDAGRRGTHQKAFLNDVKKHIDGIAAKYILPDEGTFDFALMYIPAENVYYETIIKDEASNGINLYSYAIEKHVVPVSPNSLYAHLQVIALGLRGLRVEKSAKAIIDNLSRLQTEVRKVRDGFDTLGSHLENARKKYEETDKRLTQFEDRLENVAERTLDSPPAAPQAPNEAGKIEDSQRLLS